MNLTQLINRNIVDLRLNVQNKREAIEAMADMLKKDGRIESVDEFIADVYKREELETTNMDMGVAIPHSQSKAIKKSSVALARLTSEIEWEDYGEPVKIIFMLAVSPTEEGVEHLELISKIAELLVDDKFRDMLYKTINTNKLLKRMNKLVGG